MRGISNKTYAIGVLLVFIGGAGLAQIQMDSYGCFWLFAILFSLGVGFCLAGFKE